MKNGKTIYWHKLWRICFIIVTLVKYSLVSNLPLLAGVDMDYDGELMIRLSNSIIRGEWLGVYGKKTLIKGCMFPVFMAGMRWLGLNYSNAMLLLYIISCLVFCMAINKFIQNDKFVFLLYIILLFNPASMNYNSYQYIYRNAISPAQVLLIFGSFLALYYEICVQTRYEKRIPQRLFWAVLSGVSLIFFMYSREDSIWIMPFVIAIFLIAMILVLLKIKIVAHNKIVSNILILFVPFLLLAMGKFTISSINNYYYGIRVTNEFSDTAFADCVRAIYSVKDNEDIKRVTNSRVKMHKLYEISPALSSISANLEQALDTWTLYDSNPNVGEVENGWFIFALRNAVDAAGYYSSPQSANDFYATVAEEINEAASRGLVETQATMPSALMPPWDNSYAKDFFDAVLRSVSFVFGFEGTEASLIVHDKYKMDQYISQYYEFKSVTNNYFPETETRLKISGWAFLKDSEDDVHIELISQKGKETVSLPLQNSMDVDRYFRETGEVVTPNMSMCRFACNIVCDSSDKYYLRIVTPDNSNNYIEEGGEAHMENLSIRYWIDEFYRYEVGCDMAVHKRAVDTVNGISDIYRRCNGTIGIISVVFYLIILGCNICAIKRKHYTLEYWNELMIPSALLASLLVLVIGVSYIEVYAFPAINSLYYSGGYAVALSFEIISIYYGGRIIKNIYKKEHKA